MMIKLYFFVITYFVFSLSSVFSQCNSSFFNSGSPDMTSDITMTTDCNQLGVSEEGKLTAKDGDFNWVIGDGTNSVTVTMDYPLITLDGSKRSDVNVNGVHLIINQNATLILTNDLLVNNVSKITVKNGGQLLIGGNIITNGVEGEVEKSAGVNINLEGTGSIYVEGDALLNYASGNLLNPVQLYVKGNIVTYKSTPGDTSGLESQKSTLEGVLRWLSWILPRFIEDIINDTIDEIEKTIAEIKAGEGGFDTDPGDNPSEYPANSPFDQELVIELPIYADKADFFKEKTISQYIFSESNLRNLSVSTPASLIGKVISVTSSDINITGGGELINSDVSISSIQAVRSALLNLQWELKNDVLLSMNKYINDTWNDEDKKVLSAYFDKNIKIYITIADPSSGTRTASVAHEVSVSLNSTLPDLPVELTYFQAIHQKGEVLLEWETASEQNASHFEIQRSLDKRSWRTLGKVEAAGNSQTSITYKFIDKSSQNVAYYRLLQVDFDGANEVFGPIQVVKNGITTPLDLVVMPNNVVSGESVRFSITGLIENTPLNIQVFNSFGGLMYNEVSQNIKSKSLLKEFDFTDQLSTGIYYIILSSGNNTVKEKLVIK